MQSSKPPSVNDRQSAEKSPLRHPKNAPRDEPEPSKASLHAEHQDIVMEAFQNPNALSTEQMRELVQAICQRATEGTRKADIAVQFSRFVIQKDSGEMFLDLLLGACHEWFEKRDELLLPGNASEPVAHRWTGCVSIVAGLLLVLRSHSEAGGRRLFLAKLLCDCCHVILQSPSLGNAAEMGCLQSILTSTGKAVERDAPQLMRTSVGRLWEAFVQPGLSGEARNILFELIELRAYGWEFNLSQQEYYKNTPSDVKCDVSGMIAFLAGSFNLAAFRL